MLEFARLTAVREHQNEVKLAVEKQRKDLLDKGITSKQKGLKTPKLPFRFDVSTIGVSLQFGSLQFCLDMLEYRVKNPSHKNMLEKPATDKEYHAGILYLT